MNFTRWSIWKANLDPVIGSEQGRSRPVLIMSVNASNEVLPVVNVLPLTSRKPGRRIYPNEVFLPAGTSGLTEDSIVLCYQVRTLDKRRLTHYIGTVNESSSQTSMIDALSFQLGLKF